MERLFKALCDPNRLRIVLILGRGPLNVSEISDVLHLSQSNVSHHLKALLDSDVVRREGRSGWVYYHLSRSDTLVSAILEVIKSEHDRVPSNSTDMEELALCYYNRLEASREFFDEVAEEWSSISELLPDPEKYFEAVAHFLGTPDRVLEIGCGKGSMLPRLAGLANRIIGVDNSRNMLSSSRKFIAEMGIGARAEVRLGDAEHLPVGDSFVDAVFIHMVLHHIGEPAAVLREAYRVLRPQGVCVLVELTRHESEEMRLVHGDLWPGFEIEELRLMTEKAGFVFDSGKVLADGRVYAMSCARKETHS